MKNKEVAFRTKILLLLVETIKSFCQELQFNLPNSAVLSSKQIKLVCNLVSTLLITCCKINRNVYEWWLVVQQFSPGILNLSLQAKLASNTFILMSICKWKLLGKISLVIYYLLFTSLNVTIINFGLFTKP